jgi:MFS family permease
VSRNRLLTVAAGLALADASIVTLALPRLLTELGATVEGVAAVIGVYTVVLALALLPAVRLRASIGPRRLGAMSLALFAAASVGCAAAGSLELLLAFRAVQAIGGAGALIAVFELLAAGDRDGPGRRLWTGAAVIGFAAGPALGGLLTQLFDWRAIFVAQVPLALAGAVACALSRVPSASTEGRGERSPEATTGSVLRPLVALALLSAALTAVLFLLVLMLVAGWNVEPLAAAVAVSVLPLAAVAGARLPGDDRARAAAGCALVGAGTLALAVLPLPSLWWTVVPQALAGLGMGMALPALAGGLLPERNARDAARLLVARNAGVALALLALAPIVASNLTSATSKARERGVALVLDSSLPPQDKIRLAPELLAGVEDDEPRSGLAAAVDKNRSRFTGEDRARYDRLGDRADETIVAAVGDSFRLAFALAGALALLGAVAVWPATGRRRAFVRMAAAALVVPIAYLALRGALSPEPVKIADPCKERKLPPAEGLPGMVQDELLRRLDQIACHFGSSREELVLGALASEADRRAYRRQYGVDPRAGGDLLQGLIGR